MIRFRCRCGTGQSIQPAVAGEVTACPACRSPLRVIVGGPPTGAEETAVCLLLRDGPRGAGLQVFIAGNAALGVGKALENHIVLAGNLVSRRHCRLAPTPAGWRLVDPGSTNGTFVNGRRAADHLLAAGDAVRIGEYEFVYQPAGNGAAVGVPAGEGEIPLLLDEDNSIVPPPPLPPVAARAADDGLYDFADDPAPAPVRRPLSTRAGGTRFTPVPAAPAVALPACPSCSRQWEPGVRVCVACGIDLRTGRPIITAQGLDEDALHTRAENTVRFISWLIPFGLYPIASEAFGTRRPVAIWTIAVLTVLTTLVYWAGGEQGRRFELWSQRPIPGRVEFAAVADPAEGPEVADAPEPELTDAEVEAIRALFPPAGEFHWYQLITHTLLHAGVMHLAGNMLFLLVFGTRVNALIGGLKTAILYPVLGVVAAFAQMAANHGQPPAPLVGASGAIMGLAGMYLVLFPVHKVHNVIWLRLGIFTGFRLAMSVFSVRGFWVVLFYIAFDVVYTALGVRDHVAHWAHLGGFLGGAAAALVLLVTRQVNARGGDVLSVTLGKHAWPLVGRPNAGAEV